MARLSTQVAIIGAGPAGMFLAHLLRRGGIDSLVLERRNREYVESRVRAGVLERITVDVLAELGLDDRLKSIGLTHRGTAIVNNGEMFRIKFSNLKSDAMVMVYGQQEVMKDLFDAIGPRQLNVRFDAEDVALHHISDSSPYVTWAENGEDYRLDCNFIVGCDGFHGVSRSSIPNEVLRSYERFYPFGWLGILADTPPADHELIYASHENGFALASMRSMTRCRYYLQCGLNERVEDWPDDRFWEELCVRLGPKVAGGVTRGTSFEKSIAPLRSFVSEPMRYGNLFLAGDAAHIVPPTGAKGMNLAVSDVVILSNALTEFYTRNSAVGLDSYSAKALSRVWKAERFSWWFTGLTHSFPNSEPFARKMQLAELDYLRGSRVYQNAFAENYIGLPLNLAN